MTQTDLVECGVALPAGFRVADFTAFYARDAQAVAERVDGHSVVKGLPWESHPACLTVSIEKGYAKARLEVDGIVSRESPERLQIMLRRMLSLNQPVEQFEAQYRDDPKLGILIRNAPGLRVAQTATPFEALTWAVTGQQISVVAAVSLRRKLIQMVGRVHSSGIICYPDSAAIAQLTEDDLRRASYSLAKARTLLTLARMVEEGALPIEQWALLPPTALPADEIGEALSAVRGIGPWTVNYALLRGFGWMNGSLHGDVAVRKGLQLLLGLEDKVDQGFTEEWLAQYSPWRALVGAHLWALRSIQA